MFWRFYNPYFMKIFDKAKFPKSPKISKFWNISLGSFWIFNIEKVCFRHSPLYIYNFFIFWNFKKRTTPSWSMNFLVLLMYQAQNSYFFPKIFIFFWLIWLKNLKRNFEKFYKLETCNWYQTTANFMIYHAVRFQVNRICTFFAINDTNFHFY